MNNYNVEKETRIAKLVSLDEVSFCLVLGEDNNVVESHTRLIAAAPDLLVACEVAILAMEHRPINPQDIEFIKTAVAKVEKGEQDD